MTDKILKWNPDTMTVTDVKMAAETLYTLKAGLARLEAADIYTAEDFARNVVAHLDHWKIEL